LPGNPHAALIVSVFIMPFVVSDIAVFVGGDVSFLALLAFRPDER
jgi:hypothetical protein